MISGKSVTMWKAREDVNVKLLYMTKFMNKKAKTKVKWIVTQFTHTGTLLQLSRNCDDIKHGCIRTFGKLTTS